MTTEVILGKEMGLLACWTKGNTSPMLSADLLRSLLAFVVETTDTGCMEKPQERPNRSWIADPGLYLLNLRPTDILENENGWKGLYNSHPTTEALIPINISNMHWILLQVNCETAKCTIYDSLPYTALNKSLREHVLTTCKAMFPRTTTPFSYHIVVTEHQQENSNNCAICLFTNTWRIITKNHNRKFTESDIMMIREQWLPALILSNPVKPESRIYPWNTAETYRAFNDWLLQRTDSIY
jgi:hypothetical protein